MATCTKTANFLMWIAKVVLDAPRCARHNY